MAEVVPSCSRNFVPHVILDSSIRTAGLACGPVAEVAQQHDRTTALSAGSKTARERFALIDSDRAT